MLTDEAFRVWVQRNKIDPLAEAALARIRSSPPSRRVRGRASNVSGRYPSVKMGCSIQFESQHVELWAIYAMEHDDNVLEYYDQPTRIQLHYKSRSGRKTSPWHTPDFLVIRRNGASFEEWKPETALEQLTIRMPERYQRERALCVKKVGGFKISELAGNPIVTCFQVMPPSCVTYSQEYSESSLW